MTVERNSTEDPRYLIPDRLVLRLSPFLVCLLHRAGLCPSVDMAIARIKYEKVQTLSDLSTAREGLVKGEKTYKKISKLNDAQDDYLEAKW